jgi:hypothetical protein
LSPLRFGDSGTYLETLGRVLAVEATPSCLLDLLGTEPVRIRGLMTQLATLRAVR